MRHITQPFSGSEDFSFFGKLTGTPCAFMMIDAGHGENPVSLHNGKIVFDGVVESAKTALANGIPVGLGNDVGCPYITQYDFWRELCYFHKYCCVSNRFALYTATLRNAQLAGIGVAVEKGFQGGGDKFRAMPDIPYKALAVIESADENGIIFREDD